MWLYKIFFIKRKLFSLFLFKTKTSKGDFLSDIWSTFVVHYEGFPQLGGLKWRKLSPRCLNHCYFTPSFICALQHDDMFFEGILASGFYFLRGVICVPYVSCRMDGLLNRSETFFGGSRNIVENNHCFRGTFCRRCKNAVPNVVQKISETVCIWKIENAIIM